MGVATTYSAPAGSCWAPAARAAASRHKAASDEEGEDEEVFTTKHKGDAAEQRALAHLEAAGLRLVERNYRVARGPRARAGEVDLIMRDRDGTLVFVEVRERASADHGGAAASISAPLSWRRGTTSCAWAHRPLAASTWWPSTPGGCNGSRPPSMRPERPVNGRAREAFVVRQWNLRCAGGSMSLTYHAAHA
jgi:Holliday junction resolvase-like predicted endonuclease